MPALPTAAATIDDDEDDEDDEDESSPLEGETTILVATPDADAVDEGVLRERPCVVEVEVEGGTGTVLTS